MNPIMIASGISLLHRAKYHRMSKHYGLGLGRHGHKLHKHMKGMSAIKKDPEPEPMPAVMPRRALKFR